MGEVIGEVMGEVTEVLVAGDDGDEEGDEACLSLSLSLSLSGSLKIALALSPREVGLGFVSLVPLSLGVVDFFAANAMRVSASSALTNHCVPHISSTLQ